MAFNIYFLLLLILCFTAHVHGHGRLLHPPSRSSMWRYKYTDPVLTPYKDIIQENYDDNGLNCGGKQTQIDNKGMCGICGDSYTAQIKENEAGGKYALGIITRQYKAGDVISTTIEITAQHKGYFEFRLCPWNDVHTPVTHECLSQHLLSFESGESKWYLPEDPSKAQGTHELNIRLPSDVTCDQCLLQWRYRTGNSWGYENGQQGLGLGQQEEFYGCADIGISGGSQSSLSTPDTTSYGSTTSTTRLSTLATSSVMATTTTTQPSVTSVQPSGSHTTTHSLEHSVSTTKANNANNQYPRIDCSEETMGLPIYRDCHSFYICSYPQFDPFVFACPPGTVCNPNNGRCDHPYNVPPPCNAA